jgi:hypothetical protein
MGRTAIEGNGTATHGERRRNSREGVLVFKQMGKTLDKKENM